MNFDPFDRRSAERFAELLDETTGSRRHHTRGPADEHLAELVAIGHSLSAARSGVQVDREFCVGLRAMLVAAAERDGIGSTATAVDDEPGTHAGVREPGRGLFRTSGSSRRIRTRGAIVAGVVAGAMAVSGISAASENASPGDALYGVKRSTERAQLAMAGSDVTRGQLSLDFARTRLAEAAAMTGADPAFAHVLNDMDADTRQGVRLLNGSAVARRDNGPLNTVDGFVTSQRNTLTPVLGRLSPANRERAQASLALLDAVHRRTDLLRTGLACHPVAAAGPDELGPRLTDCADGTGAATSLDRPQGAGARQSVKPGIAGKARPERTDPPVAPSDAAVPDPIAPVTTPADGPTPAQSDPPADDTGVLGGILGGILGG